MHAFMVITIEHAIQKAGSQRIGKKDWTIQFPISHKGNKRTIQSMEY